MRLERYEKPETAEACVALLRQYGSDAKLLAGGTDLIPRLRAGVYCLKAVIDLSAIPGLSGVERTEDSLFLGSMLRLRTLQKDTPLSAPYAVLSRCAGHVSSMQVRNVATLGGNACNASPSADTAPGLLLLDAVCRIRGAAGTRTLALTDFLTAPGVTALQPDEFLEGFLLPPCRPHTGAAYEKYSIRGDSDIAIVGAGAALSLDAQRRICHARIALSSVGPTALRMYDAERLLLGQPVSRELLEDAAHLCSTACAPISDQRASAAYRREMTRVFTGIALQQAYGQAAATFPSR